LAADIRIYVYKECQSWYSFCCYVGHAWV